MKDLEASGDSSTDVLVANLHKYANVITQTDQIEISKTKLRSLSQSFLLLNLHSIISMLLSKKQMMVNRKNLKFPGFRLEHNPKNFYQSLPLRNLSWREESELIAEDGNTLPDF